MVRYIFPPRGEPVYGFIGTFGNSEKSAGRLRAYYSYSGEIDAQELAVETASLIRNLNEVIPTGL